MMANEDREKMTFGEFLRQARQRSGKTQKEIAKELRLTGTTVSRWETNNYNVPHARIHEVALSYGMTDEEEHELVELRNNLKTVYQSPPKSEYRIFYDLIMLPKETRERIIKAVRAYKSASEE